jgi:GNAT superfamily N-acetyltransferase
VADDRLRFEPLARSHDRRQFSCGVDSLDRYFRNVAGQDTRRRTSAVHVMYDDEADRIAGFYTLSASALRLEELPQDIQEGLPPYQQLPAFLLGRLAVDHQYRGQGLGGLLLADALRRSLRVAAVIGAMAVIVDAIDERARDFYRRYGFEPLVDPQRRLLMPMNRIARRGKGSAP